MEPTRINIITKEDATIKKEVVTWTYKNTHVKVLPPGKYYIGDFTSRLSEMLFNNGASCSDDGYMEPNSGYYKSSKQEYLIFGDRYYGSLTIGSKTMATRYHEFGIASASLVELYDKRCFFHGFVDPVYNNYIEFREFKDYVTCNLNHPGKVTCGEETIFCEPRCDDEMCEECIKAFGS